MLPVPGSLLQFTKATDGPRGHVICASVALPIMFGNQQAGIAIWKTRTGSQLALTTWLCYFGCLMVLCVLFWVSESLGVSKQTNGFTQMLTIMSPMYRDYMAWILHSKVSAEVSKPAQR